mgnify:CR=1 FL=1
MRSSVKEGDQGYHPLAHKCKVTLNNEDIDNCFTADEELGEVHVNVEDENYQYIIEDDCIKTEILYGKVEIIPPE